MKVFFTVSDQFCPVRRHFSTHQIRALRQIRRNSSKKEKKKKKAKNAPFFIAGAVLFRTSLGISLWEASSGVSSCLLRNIYFFNSKTAERWKHSSMSTMVRSARYSLRLKLVSIFKMCSGWANCQLHRSRLAWNVLICNCSYNIKCYFILGSK